MAAVPGEIKTEHMRNTNQEIYDYSNQFVTVTIKIDNREELHGDEVAVTSAGESVC
jgi:hypothetical protein